MANEAIASMGYIYYGEENVTESMLAFRTAIDEPVDYYQHDEYGSRMM